MRTWAPVLAVAAVMTATIGLLSGPGWPMWLAGATWAFALAVGVGFTGQAAGGRAWELRSTTYARSAAVALVAGGVIWWVAGADNDVFWGVGVVLAIALSGTSTGDPAGIPTRGTRTADDRPRGR